MHHVKLLCFTAMEPLSSSNCKRFHDVSAQEAGPLSNHDITTRDVNTSCKQCSRALATSVSEMPSSQCSKDGTGLFVLIRLCRLHTHFTKMRKTINYHCSLAYLISDISIEIKFRHRVCFVRFIFDVSTYFGLCFVQYRKREIHIFRQMSSNNSKTISMAYTQYGNKAANYTRTPFC